MSASTSIAEFTIAERYKTDRRSPIRWVFSHAIRQWPFFLLAITGAIINALLASAAPILIGQAFDVVSKVSDAARELGSIALLLGLTYVVRTLVMLIRNFSFEFIAQRIERNIRDEIYINLLGKSMTFHNLQPVGDTMARATNDVREINYLFSPGINLIIGSFIFLLMPIIISPRYHPALVITPILFLVFYFISIRSYLRQLRPVTDEVRASFGALNTRLAESLDGIETVKAAAQECAEKNRFGTNVGRYRDAVINQGRVEAKFLPFLLLGLAMAFGLMHALLLARSGALEVGQVVGYFGLLVMLDFPTFVSLFAYSQMSVGLSSASRILQLMNRENNLDQNVMGYSEKMKGEIEFRNVSFSFTEDNETLHNISLRIKPGQTLAIVGQTGSGKTTLSKLVNRTFDVTEGQVLVDGIDVREWNLETLRQGISIIEQDVFLFSQTIRENIAFGRPGATEDEILDVAKVAQADDFINTFQSGYDTILGERGVTLSGGQRQRLALSRAFLTDPKILVLDDSTSAIDSATEDKIQKAIFAAARGRTTLIITHRLSQIRWADLIVVLRNGRIAAIGRHEELLKTSEAYRNIFSD
ncbi:MAG: ABC transporter ATP-binding protein/permease [Anaerolineaceae bacterium]|nr:ABC transporter ATP-binding protein/permease [Anaerolineaceae bacterium]